MLSYMERAKRAINVFMKDRDEYEYEDAIVSSTPHNSARRRDAKDIVLAPIINRIALDVAMVPIRHVNLDKNGAFTGVRKSELNERLTGLANIDQTGPVMIQDAAATMLSHGVCAFVPVVTTTKPSDAALYEILSLRVGSISEWRNRSVMVTVYNEEIGDVSEVLLSKEYVCVTYNPFYQVMNQPNSTLQRLIDKWSLLDSMDRKAASSQLDLILQLPFQVRSEKRVKEAARRLDQLEEQLANSKYGIAYVDATEKITPLNRPVKHSLMEQVQYLEDRLYNQLGLTPAVLDGTASEGEMLSYYNRTVFPLVQAITDGMRMRFLTKTARTQGQSIAAHQNLFQMAPILNVADASDKFVRNTILTPNEIRAALGFVQADAPKADELINPNISAPTEENAVPDTNPVSDDKGEVE